MLPAVFAKESDLTSLSAVHKLPAQTPRGTSERATSSGPSQDQKNHAIANTAKKTSALAHISSHNANSARKEMLRMCGVPVVSLLFAGMFIARILFDTARCHSAAYARNCCNQAIALRTLPERVFPE